MLVNSAYLAGYRSPGAKLICTNRDKTYAHAKKGAISFVQELLIYDFLANLILNYSLQTDTSTSQIFACDLVINNDVVVDKDKNKKFDRMYVKHVLIDPDTWILNCN